MSKELTSWSPFRELADLQSRISSLFDRQLAGTELAFKSDWTPAVDIAEDPKAYTITADLPDVKKEDVNVSVDNGVLSISGERRHESQEGDQKDKKFHRIERSYGKYVRTFRLPDEVDAAKVAAQFKDGVLIVTLPKTTEAKPGKVQVAVS